MLKDTPGEGCDRDSDVRELLKITLEQPRELTLPRFKPWTDITLSHFISASRPEGSIFVPGCGPGASYTQPSWPDKHCSLWQPAHSNKLAGHEMVLLAGPLSKGTVIHGVDLAPGMIELAQASIEAAGLRWNSDFHLEVHWFGSLICSWPSQLLTVETTHGLQKIRSESVGYNMLALNLYLCQF